MLELAQLECFVAAAEEIHFGRAAVRLNMTQPTLSRQIAALELALKVKLFDRTNRTVRLTSAGLVFLPEAKRILLFVERATNWTRRAWQGEAGVIRLGFTATAAFADLPLILEQAASKLPDVKFILREGTSAEQTDSMLAGTLDAALLRPPVDRSKFCTIAVRKERFIAALPKKDARTKKKVLSLSDFDGKNFIMYSADGAGYSHRMLTDMFEKEGVSPIMIHHLDQNHSILALVSAGLGAALLPDSLAKLAFPNVVFRRVELDPPHPLEMILAWRQQSENPALPIFLSLCRALFLNGG
jgi:DNA-binding transcriptional LysR family regulator